LGARFPENLAVTDRGFSLRSSVVQTNQSFFDCDRWWLEIVVPVDR